MQENNYHLRNLYYYTVLRRRNAIKEFFYSLFFMICSGPRLLIEIFVRKDFGERYFSFSSCIIIGFLMIVFPVGVIKLTGISTYGQTSHTWWHFIAWYLFIPAHIFYALRRRKEIKRNPSVFDFLKFSLSAGYYETWVENLFSKFNIDTDPRKRMTIFEPLPFLLTGIFLLFIGQYLGWVMIFSSITYSLSYMAAFHQGDNFVMDRIDNIIMNEEMVRGLIGNEDAENTRGVRFYMRKPTTEEMRCTVASSFYADTEEEVLEAV